MEIMSVNLNTKPAATSNKLLSSPKNATRPKITSSHSYENVLETKSVNFDTKSAATSNNLPLIPKNSTRPKITSCHSQVQVIPTTITQEDQSIEQENIKPATVEDIISSLLRSGEEILRKKILQVMPE